MADKPSMTADNLGAALGGVFSLWLGISIMTTVEIIELIYNMLGVCYLSMKQKRRKTGSISESLPGQPIPDVKHEDFAQMQKL